MKRTFKWWRRLFYTKIAGNSLCNGHVPVCNGFTWLNRSTSFGRDTHVNGLRVYGRGNVIIGSHVHIGRACEILTENHNFRSKAKLPYDDQYDIKSVTIENFVWLGINVLVLPGAHIGEGAIIQAGSVVSGRIDPLSIVGGNPARTFAYRNRDDYMEARNRYDIEADSPNRDIKCTPL